MASAVADPGVSGAGARPGSESRRLLYVWDADYPWDVRAEKICATLTAAGYEVHLAARNRAWSPVTERLPEATVHRLPPLRPLGRRLDAISSFPAFFNPRWLGLLSGLVRTLQPSAIIARDLPLCPTALRVAGRHGLPVIFDMAEPYPEMTRSMWEAGRQRWYDRFVRNPRAVAAVERYCIGRVDHTLVVVEESAERLVGLGVRPSTIDVVSNTPSRSRLSDFSPGERTPASGAGEPLRLAYLGLMELPRGIADLLEAVASLRGEMPVHLSLIGDGRDLAMLRARAAELGLDDEHVRFWGYVPYRDALRIIARADVGVVPHHTGSFWNATIPNKLFDYMAAGLPVLTSNAIPAARIVSSACAGEVFESRNPHDLAAAISRLRDPERRRLLGEAGRRAISERYHWERDAEVLLGAVAGVLHRRGRGAA